MIRIPDCRTDEFYNEKYLNEKDMEFISGFDYVTEFAVSAFFYNAEVYDDVFKSIGLNPRFIDTDTVTDDNKLINELTADDVCNMTKETLIFKAFRESMLHCIEMQRNITITSAIDHMPEEEYRRIKEKVDNEN